MTAKPDILLVGGGKMGMALLSGWLADDRVGRVIVVDPSLDPALCPVAHVGEAGALPAGFSPDIIVFAVKPQIMREVAPQYRALVAAGAGILSIAAGTSLAALAGHVGAEAALIRAMPNTPAAIGRGVTVAVANDHVDPVRRDQTDALLRAVGDVEWVDDEALLDAVTAVSGSGPAYVFLLIEALAAAGAQAGLPGDLATRLATATVAGAGELARRSPEPAARLRIDVTSPKGTTEAALAVLMAEDGLGPLIDRAVAAAAARSRALAR
jgi:pyrroline-5-carboxylate reductase